MFVPPSLQPSNASVRIGKQRTTQGVVLPLLVLIVIAATVETASEMRSYKIKPRRGEARLGLGSVLICVKFRPSLLSSKSKGGFSVIVLYCILTL